MANYARIINNIAVDVSATPAEHFHPTIAAEFIAVPDSVKPGWIKSGSIWSAPPDSPAPEPAISYPKLTPVQFKLLFTSAERIAIYAAKEADPVLSDAFSLLDDPRLTEVDLNLQSNRDLIAYLAAQGLITADRIPVILAGALQ